MKTNPSTHNINVPKVYPNFHYHESTENVLNLYANTEVNIGDTIKDFKKEFKIVGILNLQDEEITAKGKNIEKTAVKEAKPKFNAVGIPLIKTYLEKIIRHSTPDTLYYELKLEPLN